MYLEVAMRVLLGLVFVVAAGGKAASRPAYRSFTESVRKMGFPALVAAPVVAAEFAVVGLLVWIPLAGFALAGGMLLAFAAAVAASIRRGNTAPCRCFGRTSAPLGWHHVGRNVFLILCALAGALAPAAPVDASGVAVATMAGLIVGTLVIMLDDLRYLFSSTPPMRR